MALLLLFAGASLACKDLILDTFCRNHEDEIEVNALGAPVRYGVSFPEGIMVPGEEKDNYYRSFLMPNMDLSPYGSVVWDVEFLDEVNASPVKLGYDVKKSGRLTAMIRLKEEFEKGHQALEYKLREEDKSLITAVFIKNMQSSMRLFSITLKCKVDEEAAGHHRQQLTPTSTPPLTSGKETIWEGRNVCYIASLMNAMFLHSRRYDYLLHSQSVAGGAMRPLVEAMRANRDISREMTNTFIEQMQKAGFMPDKYDPVTKKRIPNDMRGKQADAGELFVSIMTNAKAPQLLVLEKIDHDYVFDPTTDCVLRPMPLKSIAQGADFNAAMMGEARTRISVERKDYRGRVRKVEATKEDILLPMMVEHPHLDKMNHMSFDDAITLMSNKPFILPIEIQPGYNGGDSRLTRNRMQIPLQFTFNDMQFHLVSAVLHYSDNITDGHYTALVFNGENWEEVCNLKGTSRVPFGGELNSVLSQHGRLLFYEEFENTSRS